MAEETLEKIEKLQSVVQAGPLVPELATIAVLGRTERLGFWLTHRMNLGVWKRLMTFGQRHIGSLWIYLATYNLMNVFGIENVENAAVDKPLVLVANHHSFLICTQFRASFFAGQSGR